MRLKCNQITLGGIDLKTDTYNFTVEGLFDHEKSHSESDLYGDGGLIPYTKINSKKLVLNGYINSSNANDHIIINKLLSNRNAQDLIVDVEGFRKVILSVKVSNKATDSTMLGKVSCQLIAQDPYLYAVDKDILQINETKGVGVKLPFRFPIKFIGGQDFERYVTNIGTELAYPIITIVGPCSNFTVTNITTNQKLTFANLELLANDTLIIDNTPRSRGIYLNAVNRIDLKVGNWINCDVGQNHFTFSRTSNSLEALCTVELQSRWL